MGKDKEQGKSRRAALTLMSDVITLSRKSGWCRMSSSIAAPRLEAVSPSTTNKREENGMNVRKCLRANGPNICKAL